MTHTIELTITDEEVEKMSPALLHVHPIPEGRSVLDHLKVIAVEQFEAHYEYCVKAKSKYDSHKALDTDMIETIKVRNLGEDYAD